MPSLSFPWLSAILVLLFLFYFYTSQHHQERQQHINMSAASALSIVPRRWYERGHAHHGWLRTFHTFSFASYYDPRFMSFSNLRVINEDRVSARTGFGTHPHREAEIFSLVLSGQLTHTDSMGNTETLSPGQVQFTSAGTGIRHSEWNKGNEDVHFLQIWYNPDVKGLSPRYYTTSMTDETDRLVTLIRPVDTFAPDEKDKTGLLEQGRAIPSHASLVTRFARLQPEKTVSHTLGQETTQKAGERWAYVHLAQSSGYKDPDLPDRGIKNEASIQINGNVSLKEGDGAYIRGGKVGEQIEIKSTGGRTAEVVLFDLRPE